MSKNKDIVSGLIFVALSLLIFTVSFQISANQNGLSPAAFPRFISVCIFILGLVQIKSAMNVNDERKAENHKDESTKSQIMRVVLFLAVCLIYINTLKILGFVVVTPLLVIAVMLLFHERNWLRVLSVSVLSTVFLYALFRIVFRVPLPRSFFW